MLQLPEVIEAEMSTRKSIPTSNYDFTDNSRTNNADNRMPLSPTLPNLHSEYNEKRSVRLPVEHSKLPLDGQDLLVRLLEFRPDRRIRSIFSLQRIAFFMGFNFDDAKKKKVTHFLTNILTDNSNRYKILIFSLCLDKPT